MRKLLIVALFGLVGCASQPNQVILMPMSPQVTLNPATASTLAVKSQDSRIESFLVRINRKGEPAKLLAANDNPRQVLVDGLINGLSQQGYQMDALGETQITLNLERLMVDVDQTKLNYTAESVAIASLVVEKKTQRLEKRFMVKGKLSGVMAAEHARMEREINDRLAQLLETIVNDPELHQFIQ